jgi:chromosome segregation ATPase
MERDEVVHKMSKKIAQLTKVIFHLNTRNDEADCHLRAVTEANEREVTQVVEDANAQVKKLAQVLAKCRNEGAAKQIETFKCAIEEEKCEARREVEQLRASMSAREQKNTTMWSEKVKQFAAEVGVLRGQSQQQSEQFDASLRKAATEHADAVEALQAKHLTELDGLKSAHVEQLRAKDDERAAAEAAQQRMFEERLAQQDQLLAAKAQRCDELEALWHEATKQLEERLGESQDAFKRMQAERDAHAAELDRLRPEIERLRAATSDGADGLRQRDAQLDALNAEKQSLLAQVQQLQDQLQASEVQLGKTRAELEQFLRKAAQEKDASSQSAETERRRLLDKIQGLEQREAELLREGGLAQGRICTLEAETAALKAEIESLRERASDSLASIDAAAKRSQEEIRELQEKLAKQLNETQRLEATLAEQAADFQRQLESALSVGSQDLNALREAHTKEMEAMRQKHEEQAAEAKRAHDGEVCNLRCSHDEEQQRLRSSYESQLDDLRRKMAESGNANNAQSAEHARREAELLKQIESLELQLREARDQATKDAATIQKLETDLASIENDLKKTVADAEKQRREHAELTASLQARLQGDMAQANAAGQQELERLRKELQRELAAKDQQAAADRDRLQGDLAREREKGEAALKELQRRLDELTDAADAAKNGASSELAQVRSEMQRQLEETRAKAVETVHQMSQEHQSKLTEIYEQQKNDLQQLQEKLTGSHQERVDGMREKHQREMEELKAKHAIQLQQALDAHTKQLEEQGLEHRSAVKTLEEEVKATAEKYQAESNRLQSELQQRAVELADSQAAAQRLERRSADAEATVARLEVNLKTAEREHGEAMQRKDEEVAKEKRSLKQHHKSELEALLQEQLRETTQLKEQFDQARQLQDSQIDLLQQRVQELQDLYDARPSRDEDVERIAALEAAVEEKESTIRKLVDEMQFYKLELVNREQNYNKVFGASPLVGTLNPVASQPGKKGAAPQMRVVQQPGAGMMQMNMGLPPLGNLVAGGAAAGGPGPPPKKSLQKRPSSGNMTRAAVS